MFKRRQLNDPLIWNLLPATGLQKVGTGATKGWKSKKFEKIQLGEHLATN